MREEVVSPCINICVINECTGFCAGCLRTVEEIAGWSSRTNAAKRDIMIKVDARRQLIQQTRQDH